MYSINVLPCILCILTLIVVAVAFDLFHFLFVHNNVCAHFYLCSSSKCRGRKPFEPGAGSLAPRLVGGWRAPPLAALLPQPQRWHAVDIGAATAAPAPVWRPRWCNQTRLIAPLTKRCLGASVARGIGGHGASGAWQAVAGQLNGLGRLGPFVGSSLLIPVLVYFSTKVIIVLNGIATKKCLILLN